jgi:4-carboxymuconolactone decarboxylase
MRVSQAIEPVPSVSRILPLHNLDDDAIEALSKTPKGPAGQPLNIFLVLARHPRLLKRFNVLAGLFAQHGLLTARQREIVVLRTAWRTNSPYEWGQHVLLAREVGVLDDEIATIRTETLRGWSPDEASLLRLTDELLADIDVSEDTWEELTSSLDDAQVIEALMLVGFYRMAAGFLNAARVPMEPYLPVSPTGADVPDR